MFFHRSLSNYQTRARLPPPPNSYATVVGGGIVSIFLYVRHLFIVSHSFLSLTLYFSLYTASSPVAYGVGLLFFLLRSCTYILTVLLLLLLLYLCFWCTILVNGSSVHTCIRVCGFNDEYKKSVSFVIFDIALVRLDVKSSIDL